MSVKVILGLIYSFIHHTLTLLFSLIILRPNHQLGPDQLVKVFLTQRLQLHRALLQREALLVRILRHFASHVVANLRVEACHEHKTFDNNMLACFAIMVWHEYLRFLYN
jgi:hypothetical protein